MKILVIGAGYQGKRHALNLRDLGAEVFIYDTDQTQMAWTIQEKFEWVDEIDIKSKWDGIVISTPPKEHLSDYFVSQTMTKNVLIEKPLALSVKDLESMGPEDELDYIKDSGMNIMMAHNYLFDPRLHEHKKEHIHLFNAGNTWSYFSLDYLKEWHGVEFANTFKDGHEAKDGCGAISVSHTIYILDYLFGIPDWEEYWKFKTGLGIEADDTVAGVRGKDGRNRVIIKETWNHKGVKVHGLAPYGRQEGFDWSKSKIDKTYKTMMAAFLRVIKGEQEIPPLCRLKEGIRITQQIEKMEWIKNEYI